MEGGIAEAYVEDFPEVNASLQLNLEFPEELPIDPISSKVETDEVLKEETETRTKAKEKAAAGEEKSKLGTTLMSALVISSVLAAAIGAGFLISKKLKKT